MQKGLGILSFRSEKDLKEAIDAFYDCEKVKKTSCFSDIFIFKRQSIHKDKPSPASLMVRHEMETGKYTLSIISESAKRKETENMIHKVVSSQFPGVYIFLDPLIYVQY